MLWVVNGKKLKNLFFIIIAAFFAALILFVQKQELSVFTPVKQSGALAKVETKQKHLALTFDSNWGDRQIGLILKTLKDENVKATFFFSGEWAERHPEIIRKALKDGHEVESHGMRHEDYTQLDIEKVRRDMLFSGATLYKTGGTRPVMIRPPYGKINETVLQAAKSLNLQLVLWSVNPQDEMNPGYKEIVHSILKDAGKGDIIRLHASDSAKQTYRALPFIIRELENRGYTFVTVQTLMADGKSSHRLLD
ncbi:polysaccharide deacetylase family protein [Sporolactobacillus sp. THM19-2]|jgi:polysaccharide deacetylase family sporulation protein PdaB|uniref:polysaccharide deacetylase family protein n=1 Tax=Sporolactobacillus sp. THM19-2 TaxID=2511171 RepID=UPI001020E57A|nr:polysaccharide deacetylase family protein [Sporolactobacillus sp. THM19-2]RYL89417.1 polysaccharide deacetylase [Sporolactobacillus sp. THM19-2]